VLTGQLGGGPATISAPVVLADFDVSTLTLVNPTTVTITGVIPGGVTFQPPTARAS